MSCHSIDMTEVLWEHQVERRLAAILAADVVGYSRLIGADEAGTLGLLRALRKELVEPALKRHRGRVVKLMGDGLLAEFASVVDAVAAAVEIQAAVPERSAHLPEDQRVVLRIGVNIGDVVVEDGDLFGDGVNIAARLQEIADPNGVAISEGAHRELRGKLNLPFADAGEKDLKNIAEPVRTWMWSAANVSGEAFVPEMPPDLPDKPSIAVLPFENMSGDPEQEYFADGMAEDIITGISKFNWLFVIARNSTFTYKGKAVDIRAIAKELGVRYVLEGSIRRGGNRIRVTGQLIDAETGNHLWAERYDRALDDIFEVQDEVTAAIVAAIAPEIGQAEIERAKRKPPDNLDAWALYQRGLAHYPSGVATDWDTAIELFDRARKADPNFVDALVMAAHLRTRYAHFHNPANRDELLQTSQALLQEAMRLDPRHSMCHAATGRLQILSDELEAAVTNGREAVALNPNSALANLEFAIALMNSDQCEESLQYFEAANRLSPRDPHRAGIFAGHATALYMLGRFEESADLARKSSQSANPRPWNDITLIAALYKLGRTVEMETVKAVLLSRQPDFKISSHWLGTKMQAAMSNILREAGLPE